MEKFENTLPLGQTFDDEVEELFDVYVDVADALRQKYGDVIDFDVEMTYSDMPALWGICETLTKLTYPSDFSSDAVKDATITAYRAACFGIQSARGLSAFRTELPMGEYLGGIDPSANPADVIRIDVQEYLQRRKEIDRLIGYFMPEIDQTGLYADHAETMMGLIFMLAERNAGRQYLHGNTDLINMAMFEIQEHND